MTWLDRTLWPAIIVLAGSLVLFQCTGLDLTLQDRIYNFSERRWTLPRDSKVLEFTFHQLPKYLIFLLVAVMLVRFFADGRVGFLQSIPRPSGRRLGVLLLTLALTPALVSLTKKATRVHCPWAVQRYGGPEPYVRPLSSYEECCPPGRKGECWPAGHASGGFALFALASLAVTPRGIRRGLLAGALMGVITGGYQMLKGAHYLSDTVVTMLLAWIIHLLARRFVLKPTSDASPSHA